MPGPLVPRLELHGLTFGWPGVAPRWQGWSAALPAGLTVVVGGDGAGKTTALRLMAAVLAPTQGHLVLHLSGAQACDTAAQLQSYRAHTFWCDPASDALDRLSGHAYLERQRSAHTGWRDDVAADLLAELELDAHLHKPLLGLSMGMRRKLRLAAALASGAALTLLDDPLAALDRRSVDTVNGLLGACAEGTHRVFVTTAHEPPVPGAWGPAHLLVLQDAPA